MPRSTSVALALVVACTLGACGGPVAPGGPDSAGPGASTSAPATPAGPATVTDAPTQASASVAPASDPVPYLPWGPDTAPVPGQYLALAAADGTPPRCDDVANDTSAHDASFWEFVTQMCAAMTAGGPWPAATSVPALPETSSLFERCLNDEIAAVLASALTWHAKHPAAHPVVAYANHASRSPCQDRIYSVTVLTGDDAPGGFAPGSVAVEVAYATDGPEVPTRVWVDGKQLDDSALEGGSSEGLAELTFPVPAASTPRDAAIEVRTEFAHLTASVRIPAVEDPPAGPTGGATP